MTRRNPEITTRGTNFLYNNTILPHHNFNPARTLTRTVAVISLSWFLQIPSALTEINTPGTKPCAQLLLTK